MCAHETKRIFIRVYNYYALGRIPSVSALHMAEHTLQMLPSYSIIRERQTLSHVVTYDMFRSLDPVGSTKTKQDATTTYFDPQKLTKKKKNK